MAEGGTEAVVRIGKTIEDDVNELLMLSRALVKRLDRLKDVSREYTIISPIPISPSSDPSVPPELPWH